MAPDSGEPREEVSTVITCEGTLGNPEFPRQFRIVIDRLNDLLGVLVKIRKLEPWNSVRVTLSVPREAALRLRQLAQQGAYQLRALGILSVQVDGEGAISLRLQGANGQPQEVVLRTTQDGSSSSTSASSLGLGALLPTASGNSSSNSQVQFKSPNVVCPPDSVVPRVGTNMGPPQSAIASNSLNKPPFAGPFPFASMNQAIHSQSNNNNSGSANGSTNGPRSTSTSMDSSPPFLPPPYPGVRLSPSSAVTQVQPPTQPAVTISSPLLVNLLQNDHQSGIANANSNGKVTDLQTTASQSITRPMRPPLAPSSATKASGILAPPTTSALPSHLPSSTVPSTQPLHMKTPATVAHSGASSNNNTNNNLIVSQANVLVNSSNNNLSGSSSNSGSSNSSVSPPSALSTSVASNNGHGTNAASAMMLANNSTVTSTQMAINNIANSLANAANTITGNANVAAQHNIYGVQKGPFVKLSGQAGVQHYQRTPQGSIIAINRPPVVANQILGTSNQANIPISSQRSNLPLVQNQGQTVLLRQQQQTNGIPQKTAQTFGHHHATIVQQQQHQHNLVTQGQVKLLSGNGLLTSNNMLAGNNSLISASGPISHSTSLNRTIQQIPSNLGGQVLNELINQQTQNGAGLEMNQSDVLNTQVVSQSQVIPNIIKKPLPSPPPYSVAISRNWDSMLASNSNLLDFDDFKPDELDDLLPGLDNDALPELSELELLGSTLNSCSDVTTNLCESEVNSKSAVINESAITSGIENGEPDGRKFLINPLTGELEPHSGSEESDVEDVKDVFTGLPSPLGLSDEDTNSTTRPDTTTDQSDSETRSSTEGKHSRVKYSKIRREGRDSPGQKPTEKIKLRLKLEKNEPINPAYKVDVSFINTQQPKKASTSVLPSTTPSSVCGEGLRVPPLHISLRGRNATVISQVQLNPDGTSVIKKSRKIQGKLKKDGSKGDEALDLNEYKKTKRLKTNHEHKELLSTLTDGNPMSPSNNTILKYSAAHNHYKEKQKERRGSDSELVRTNNKKLDPNGILAGNEKKRRLSQSEGEKLLKEEPAVLGSTNVGTVAVLPQKIRKEKTKIKESFKVKDANRKLYAKSGLNAPSSPSEKKQPQHAVSSVALPTAVDLDMEAKFKQSLMEGVIGEKGISRPPHRTVEVVGHVQTDGTRIGSISEKVLKSPETTQNCLLSKEKSPEPDKCNIPDRDRKSVDSLQERDKQLIAGVTSGGRSPNSGSSGGQGEDSGIESMDALSEKSPNQASQSPHADILPNAVVPTTNKSQVPDMLDIEAQLAKMEGLDPHQEIIRAVPNIHQKNNNSSSADKSETMTKSELLPNRTTDDVNENECLHRNDSKTCYDLTCTLQDELIKETVDGLSEVDEKDVAASLKTATQDEQPSNSPPALRVAPALYSYPSDPTEKGGGEDGVGCGNMGNNQNCRGRSESPMLTTEDEDSNSGPLTQQLQMNNKTKSLLEQLLIEIPNEHHGNSITPSSHSPATRSSVRTRALSKLGSPELGSPVSKTLKAATPTTTTAKRKRNESDSSNQSLEENKKRSRKTSAVDVSEPGKKTVQQQTNAVKKSNKSTTGQLVQQQPQQQEESSDSDEPLIEKVRKNVPKSNVKQVAKTGVVSHPVANAASTNQINKINIRRSARAGQQQDKQQPAQNTRSREKGVQQVSNHAAQGQQSTNAIAEAEAALRRKTRSADVESKRKKEVK